MPKSLVKLKEQCSSLAGAFAKSAFLEVEEKYPVAQMFDKFSGADLYKGLAQCPFKQADAREICSVLHNIFNLLLKQASGTENRPDTSRNIEQDLNKIEKMLLLKELEQKISILFGSMDGEEINAFTKLLKNKLTEETVTIHKKSASQEISQAEYQSKLADNTSNIEASGDIKSLSSSMQALSLLGSHLPENNFKKEEEEYITDSSEDELSSDESTHRKTARL